jgi:hypothetical protein
MWPKQFPDDENVVFKESLGQTEVDVLKSVFLNNNKQIWLPD